MVKDNGSTVAVTDGTHTFEAERTQLTTDPAAAQIAARADYAAQVAATGANEEARRKLAEEKNEYWAQRENEKEIVKEAKEAQQQIEARSEHFGIEVLQVLPDGVLAVPLETHGVATGSARYGGGGGGVRISVSPSNKVIFVQGLTGFAENERLAIQTARDGTYTYTDTSGASRTVEKWIFIKRTDK